MWFRLKAAGLICLGRCLFLDFMSWGDAPSYDMSDFQSDCFFIDDCVLKSRKMMVRETISQRDKISVEKPYP